MSSNIRFTVHSNNERGVTDPMFRMLSILTVVTPIFSEETQHLNSMINHVVSPNLSSQLYETTEKKYESCSICTEEYNKNDYVSVLKCNHVYHPKCIKEWCKRKTCCPLCKESIPTVNRYVAR